MKENTSLQEAIRSIRVARKLVETANNPESLGYWQKRLEQNLDLVQWYRTNERRIAYLVNNLFEVSVWYMNFEEIEFWLSDYDADEIADFGISIEVKSITGREMARVEMYEG